MYSTAPLNMICLDPVAQHAPLIRTTGRIFVCLMAAADRQLQHSFACLDKRTELSRRLPIRSGVIQEQTLERTQLAARICRRSSARRRREMKRAILLHRCDAMVSFASFRKMGRG